MRLRAFVLPALFALFAGCGHSEEEWQAQLAKYEKLSQEHSAAQDKLSKTTQELEAAKSRVADLEAKLKAMGLSLEETTGKVTKLSASLEEQEKALREYKERARQLEAIKARFEALKKKLDQLTKLGLAVNIRNNRMVISLPGDVLFDSGQDTLKKDGKDILDQVAGIVKADGSLISRNYQVAGHTDNKPFRGAGSFKDNWGLSLMRARGVLLHLVDAGGMPRDKWSAAGFADTDPIAPNDDEPGRQKNRRCDLIVVPSVEEMLDLKSLAN
ncbi:MAG: OmpA family protein [Polyangiaceae bacterium]|nr:OmpA family protein [Polyangiaceae bacterium]